MTKLVKPFEWNEENTKKACDLYTAQFALIGHEVNKAENMDKIVLEIGCKNLYALRSKLSNPANKVYQKATGATVKPTTAKGKVTKIETCRLITSLLGDAGLDLKADSLDTLAKGNASELNIVVQALTAIVAERDQMLQLEEPEEPEEETEELEEEEV